MISQFVLFPRCLISWKRFKLSLVQVKLFSETSQPDIKENFNPFKKKFVSKNLYVNESRVANRVCLTVIGNGAYGQPRCVGLFTDLKGYLFNCGEGVGRLCREYDINISQIKHIFITERKWENLSGLSDIIITNETFGVRKMYMHGPPGIEYFSNLLTASITSLQLVKKPVTDNSYIDHSVKIEYVPVKKLKNPVGSKNRHQEDENAVSFSYICNIFEKQGELLLEECIKYGVPVGPDLLKLKKGEDVTLPCGKVVYASDVHSAAQPGTTFLVVDCPSEEYLDAFVNEEKFHKCQLPHDGADGISAVFHFSPVDVIKMKKYEEWINRFHQNTYHFLLNSYNPSMSSAALHQTQNVLHLLHPEIFGLIQEVEKPTPVCSYLHRKIMQPPPFLQYYFRPAEKLCWSNTVSLNQENCIESAKSIPGFEEELEILKNKLKCIPRSNENTYPEVLFLGTGSATSTAYRNVSCILININSHDSILLDCGEGTFTQLVRYFGQVGANDVLRRISCIFISHRHTDHYLGLFQILKARTEAFAIDGKYPQPLNLILPYAINDSLKKFAVIFESFGRNIRTFFCRHMMNEKGKESKLNKFLGDLKLQTVLVEHCSDAYGIVLEYGSKWKIVYSGDTAPCQKLINAGMDCTLLIHEATIEDNLLYEANMKKHSTPQQVIDISEKMNAQYTIMTHFSKRYLAVPVLQEYDKRHVGYAFDFMKVHLHDLPLLPLFVPAMKSLFQEQLHSHLEKSTPVATLENALFKSR
ncbi:Zinc phosphodiesterase ELAC protein 2, partial [Stegodyphus mimosarum]